MKKALTLTFLVLGLAVFVFARSGPKFLKDDPLMTDEDNISIPKPTERPLSKTIDLLQKSFTKPHSGNTHAVNVNTLEEVPESSWFTNRMSKRALTIEELVRGPNSLDSGPDLSQPVVILDAKTEGATPGLLIRDARGDRYFFKFDPLNNPQMATSTEVVGTKFFYALGYNVPENYLVIWNPKDYVIKSRSRVLWDTGKQEPLTKGYVENLIRVVPKRPDGTVQVLASKFLAGEPLGPFDYQGTRMDDPNDIYPHEDRRELRGLYIFQAWMNHNDSDSVNTLDMYGTDAQGRKFVRHCLIDFGTILGSGATHPHNRRVGNEYYIVFDPVFKSLGTLGLWERGWHHREYPEYRSIGRVESKYFEPQEWKPDYPFPPGEKVDREDAFWAARSVMRFTDDMIRAIVKEGKWEEPGAEDYLAGVIIERRDKIVRYYLTRINPLDLFEQEGNDLHFTNLGVQAGLASGCSYDYEWHRFDNGAGAAIPLAQRGSTSEHALPIPQDSSEFLLVRISSNCSQQPDWKRPVAVYLRNENGTRRVVGIERH